MIIDANKLYFDIKHLAEKNEDPTDLVKELNLKLVIELRLINLIDRMYDYYNDDCDVSATRHYCIGVYLDSVRNGYYSSYKIENDYFLEDNLKHAFFGLVYLINNGFLDG